MPCVCSKGKCGLLLESIPSHPDESNPYVDGSEIQLSPVEVGSEYPMIYRVENHHPKLVVGPWDFWLPSTV